MIRAIGFICGLLLLLFVTIQCSSGQSHQSQESTQAQESPVINGKKIFRQYCVTCHGVNGDMGGNGAHDLTRSVLSLEERVAVITNGRNTMTPFKGLLSEEKIAAVAEYTLELKED